MRAKEFIVEYMHYTPTQLEPTSPIVPIDDAAKRVNYLVQCGEARDMTHALKIVANEVACELELDPVEIESRIKGII